MFFSSLELPFQLQIQWTKTISRIDPSVFTTLVWKKKIFLSWGEKLAHHGIGRGRCGCGCRRGCSSRSCTLLLHIHCIVHLQGLADTRCMHAAIAGLSVSGGVLRLVRRRLLLMLRMELLMIHWIHCVMRRDMWIGSTWMMVAIIGTTFFSLLLVDFFDGPQFFFELHSPVLEPDLDLTFGQAKSMSNLDTTTTR